MNSRGQAFSAFQLLISAVVAVAVLGVIMTILGIVEPPTQDPSGAAVSTLQTLINQPGTLQNTETVIFQKNSTISAEALADQVSLTPTQIILDLGVFKDDSSQRFKLFGDETSGKTVLQWQGELSREAKLAVLCATNGESLATYAGDYEDQDALYEVDDYGCYGQSDSGRCCLIQLRRA